MKKNRICMLLAFVLLLSLCACGGAPTPAEEIHSTGISFAEAYPAYEAVRNLLISEVNTRVSTHNDYLRAAQPDAYLLNSNLLLLTFAPFGTPYPDMGRALSDTAVESVQVSLRSVWPDAELCLAAPGCYEAVFTYVDRSSDTDVNRAGKCVWECNGENGALRVCVYVDGVLKDFTEFVPQSNGRYLISSMKDRALVEYDGASITALWFEHRIYEPALGSFPGDVRAITPENGFYPDGACSIDYLISDTDAEYVFTLENDVMAFKGKVSQDLLDATGNKIGVSWIDTDSITLNR